MTVWTAERRARYSEMMRERQARRWDWLPCPEARPEYERMRDSQKIHAAEAKRIILESYRAA